MIGSIIRFLIRNAVAIPLTICFVGGALAPEIAIQYFDYSKEDAVNAGMAVFFLFGAIALNTSAIKYPRTR